MSISIEIEIPSEAPSCDPPPAWSGAIPVKVVLPTNSNQPVDPPVEVTAIALEGKLGNKTLWPRSFQPVYPQTISATGSIFQVRVPFSREIIAAIENQRRGGGPAIFNLDVAVVHHFVHKTGEAWDAPKFVSDSQTASRQIHWNVHRDPWRTCLKTLGWKEVEVFEVQAGDMAADPNLAAALKLLRDAENAMRTGGDPKLVLTTCYQALESAAKYEGAGEKKKGFELLLGRAFPESIEKTDVLSALLKNLNDFTQFGRHAGYPAVHVSYEEARFTFVVTLAAFSLLTMNHDRKA